MGMGLSTKAKSSGSCESDRIEEEKNFSQVSDEDTDDDTDSKKAKGRSTLHCLAAAAARPRLTCWPTKCH